MAIHPFILFLSATRFPNPFKPVSIIPLPFHVHVNLLIIEILNLSQDHHDYIFLISSISRRRLKPIQFHQPIPSNPSINSFHQVQFLPNPFQITSHPLPNPFPIPSQFLPNPLLIPANTWPFPIPS